jgi:Pyridoxamine 5'-phosphate oxidase
MTQRAQRRGRAIAMTTAEVDEFLAAERTCRVATAGQEGRPHVAPLWFVWDDGSLWLSSVVRSQRWTDLMRDPRVAVVIDAGVAYTELRGVELSGEVVPVGDIPRTATPDQVLDQVEQLFADKYTGGVKVQADGRHAWLRLTPEKLVSWDFRKLATLSRLAERPRSRDLLPALHRRRVDRQRRRFGADGAEPGDRGGHRHGP